jgi:RHS repeat-associated protein
VVWPRASSGTWPKDGTTKYVTGPGGLPIEQVSPGGTVLYYYQDQLGSTRGLLDAAGTTAATYTYDPNGNLKSSTGSVSDPFQYAGQYTDSESGLQYLRARYYDPSTQQFLTVDPMSEVTGEPYTYTGGNPVNGVDPLGLFCLGRICSDQVAQVLGQIGSNASTVVPVAIYSVVLTGAVVCAYFTLGACVAADVATGGLLFGVGASLASAMLPLGKGLSPSDGGENCTSQEASIGALFASGVAIDRNGLSFAGRSYQKHMDLFQLPRVSGGRQLNQAGQELLEEILTNPGTVRSKVSAGLAAGGLRFVGPNGIGATFNAEGKFLYFGRHVRP